MIFGLLDNHFSFQVTSVSSLELSCRLCSGFLLCNTVNMILVFLELMLYKLKSANVDSAVKICAFLVPCRQAFASCLSFTAASAVYFL